MEDAMVEMMTVVMPYMKPVMWAAAGVAIIAAVLAVVGAMSGMVHTLGWLVALTGLMFIAFQFAGQAMEITPAINFGDSSKFEFNLRPFWQIGLALLVPGFILTRVRRGLGVRAAAKSPPHRAP